MRLCVCQGVLGGLCSGKSALVHRHLTGSYLPLENADGWFFPCRHLQCVCVSVCDTDCSLVGHSDFVYIVVLCMHSHVCLNTQSASALIVTSVLVCSGCRSSISLSPYLPGRQYIKDVLVEGQSHLLIIREETELPGAQVGWELTYSPITWTSN